MKPLFLFALAALLSGCAEDTPPAAEVREQFQSGFTGQERYVPAGAPQNPPPPQANPQ
jgi:hypothetical protein